MLLSYEFINHYRRVRDEIRAFIESLPGGLEKAMTSVDQAGRGRES